MSHRWLLCGRRLLCVTCSGVGIRLLTVRMFFFGRYLAGARVESAWWYFKHFVGYVGAVVMSVSLALCQLGSGSMEHYVGHGCAHHDAVGWYV